jgi:hypothetical protein
MCGRDQKLWLHVATCWKIVMVYAHCKVIDTCCL